MTTYIDLQRHAMAVAADNILNFEIISREQKAGDLARGGAPDSEYQRALLRVYLRSGQVMFSTLSWRELRNRLRKAGHDFI